MTTKDELKQDLEEVKQSKAYELLQKSIHFGKLFLRASMFLKETSMLSEEYQKLFIKALDKAPDYFFKVPASSSGKYHPKYTCTKGGLVKHTKAAFWIGVSLLKLEQNAHLLPNKDEILLALLLHDIQKHGNNTGKTVFYHPLFAAEFARDCGANEQVQRLIRSHMGQWNTKEGHEDLPLPETGEELFVHMCDYLASRPFIQVDFRRV